MVRQPDRNAGTPQRGGAPRGTDGSKGDAGKSDEMEEADVANGESRAPAREGAKTA